MQRKNGPVRCSSCGVIGHNKRRCKDATDEAKKATTQANKTKRVSTLMYYACNIFVVLSK
jgi:hypothetical protein